MSDHTPTTAQIRTGYASVAYTHEGVDLRLVVFDRWLAAHDAEVRAEALHDAFWAVHAHRFDHTKGIRSVNSLYAGVQASKYAISELHRSPIIRPWVPVKQEGAD